MEGSPDNPIGIVAVAFWIAAQAVYQVRGRLDPALIWRLNFGLGISHSPWYDHLAAFSTLGIGLVLAVAIYRERRGCHWLPGRLLLVGLTLLVMGIAPAVGFPFTIEGFGDRVNVAGALGFDGVTTAAVQFTAQSPRAIVKVIE